MTEAAVAPAAGLVAPIAAGLAERFERRLRSADRLDALELRSGAIASDELRADPAARDAVAHDLVARLVRVAADADLSALARSLARQSPQRIADLAEGSGVPRIVLSPRVDDLVEAGIAERDLLADSVAATPLGAAVVALLTRLEDETARAIAARLGAEDR